MSKEELWNKFLSIIENEITNISFLTWFNEEDTKIYSYEDNTVTIVVNQELIKNHLENHYLEIMHEGMKKIIGNDVNFKIILEDDLKKIKEEKGNENNKEIKKFEKQSYQNANLNPNYTFETFVVGKSNNFAYKASRVIAEDPGAYNPLFIYGESGVGKTHLMHAVGNYLIENTNKKVLYVTSDKFVDEYTHIFRYSDKFNFDKIDAFKEKYRNIDVLLIDDIQFLGNAPKGQEEFFHTFQELYSNNKQLVIASDRSIDELNSIENRLLTRLNGGLTVNILTPEYDLRINIIKNKLLYKEVGEDIPFNVIEYIANNFDSDVRSLEGAITRVLAYSSMFNKGIVDLDIAIEALKDQLKDKSIYKNDVQRIQRAVCDYYKISIEQIKGKSRNDTVNFPRQIAIYLCRELTTESFPKIGKYFGGRRHSTIISADNKIRRALENNNELKNVIKELKKILT